MERLQFFTTVSVININNVGVAGNFSVNILSGFDAADANTNTMLHCDGTRLTSTPLQASCECQRPLQMIPHFPTSACR
ncbi:hypothetical protein [Pseudomonas serbica]